MNICTYIRIKSCGIFGRPRTGLFRWRARDPPIKVGAKSFPGPLWGPFGAVSHPRPVSEGPGARKWPPEAVNDEKLKNDEKPKTSNKLRNIDPPSPSPPLARNSARPRGGGAGSTARLCVSVCVCSAKAFVEPSYAPPSPSSASCGQSRHEGWALKFDLFVDSSSIFDPRRFFLDFGLRGPFSGPGAIKNQLRMKNCTRGSSSSSSSSSRLASGVVFQILLFLWP